MVWWRFVRVAWGCATAPLPPPPAPTSGVSGKCDIYSVVGGDTSSVSSCGIGLSLGMRLQGPVGNWTTSQETGLSQRMTISCKMEGLTTQTMDTGDRDCSSQTTSRAALLSCLRPVYKHFIKGAGQSFRDGAKASTGTGTNYRL